MKKKALKLSFVFLQYIFLVIYLPSAKSIRSIQEVREAIVRIEVFPKLILADLPRGKWMGTGCIVDKNRGLIVTNKHVAGGPGLFGYKVVLANGKQLDAVQLFYDNSCDISVIKVDPSELKNVCELNFTNKKISIGQKNIIISNNEGQNFSYQEGIIVDVSEISNPGSFQVIVSSMNTRGGSSGAPLLNENYEIIGLNFGGNDTYSSAVHVCYIKKIVEDLQKDQIPVRNNLGVQLKHCNIYDAVKFLQFPKNEADNYSKKNNNCRGRILMVDYVMPNLKGSCLQEGDLIWKINGKSMNSEVINVDFASLSDKASDTIELTIFRNGSFQNIKTPLFPINQSNVRKIINFCGANFFTPDLSMSSRSSITKGRILFTIEPQAPSFNHIVEENYSIVPKFNCFELVSIDNQNIFSIEDLEQKLKQISIRDNFVISYRSIVPRRIYNYNDYEFLSVDFSRSNITANIKVLEKNPQVVIYNLNKNNKWDTINL